MLNQSQDLYLLLNQFQDFYFQSIKVHFHALIFFNVTEIQFTMYGGQGPPRCMFMTRAPYMYVLDKGPLHVCVGSHFTPECCTPFGYW